MRRNGSEIFPVVSIQKAERSSAQPHRSIKHRIEHRHEVSGRGIDDLKYFGGGGLLLRELIALGKSLIEPPLQLSVGTPKVDYFVIERCGHVLTRRPLAAHNSTGTRRQSGRAFDSITFSPKTSSRL